MLALDLFRIPTPVDSEPLSGRSPCKEDAMTDTPGYIPSPRQWVREQVELYESSGGTRAQRSATPGCP